MLFDEGCIGLNQTGVGGVCQEMMGGGEELFYLVISVCNCFGRFDLYYNFE